MWSIAICDDNIAITKELHQITKNYFALNDATSVEIQMYQDGNKLLSDYQDHQRFHIIFMDIEMPSCSGIDIARQIRQLDSNVLLIFVTNYPDYVLTSLKGEIF